MPMQTEVCIGLDIAHFPSLMYGFIMQQIYMMLRWYKYTYIYIASTGKVLCRNIYTGWPFSNPSQRRIARKGLLDIAQVAVGCCAPTSADIALLPQLKSRSVAERAVLSPAYASL